MELKKFVAIPIKRDIFLLAFLITLLLIFANCKEEPFRVNILKMLMNFLTSASLTRGGIFDEFSLQISSMVSFSNTNYRRRNEQITGPKRDRNFGGPRLIYYLGASPSNLKFKKKLFVKLSNQLQKNVYGNSPFLKMTTHQFWDLLAKVKFYMSNSQGLWRNNYIFLLIL